VRREQQVGATPQRVAIRQRLGICDVESGANVAGIERLNQCICVHNRTACGIDQKRALPHQRELARADQMVRFSS